MLLSYIVIELLEHKTDLGKPHGALSGKLAPLIGGATGLIPQCGFSVMAAKLYENRHITVGTLLAVFLATSDEAFIILLSSGKGAVAIMPMIAIKLAVGVGTGYLADALVRRKAVAVGEHEHYDCTSCGREHDEKRPLTLYFLAPLLHSLQVAAYILLVNLAFGFLFAAIGEARVTEFLAAGVWVQPLIAAFISPMALAGFGTYPTERPNAQAFNWHYPQTANYVLAVVNIFCVYALPVENANLVVEEVPPGLVGNKIALQLYADVAPIACLLA